VHVACVIALGLAPLAWTDKLGAQLDAPETIAAARRVSSVATASRETQIETLLALLANDRGDRFVRAHVPGALAKLSAGASAEACAEITGALLAALTPTSQEPAEVLQGCTLALGKLGGVDDDEVNRAVRATLQRIVLGGERQARSFALIALAQRAARTQAADVVADTRAFLGQRLANAKAHERAWAALALGVLEHGRANTGEANSTSVRAVMLSALKDSGSPDEIGALAIGCGLTGDRDATSILMEKLARVSDARTQGHIMVGLGLIGDTRATNALRDVLARTRFQPELMASAAIGLALLEDRSLVPALVDMLARAGSGASQATAASVLGWIGDRRAIDPLLALLADRNATATARGFAANALGRVCDKDRLPWDAVLSEDVHYLAATATLIGGDGTGVLEIH
jgi:HEAT repeat protein